MTREMRLNGSFYLEATLNGFDILMVSADRISVRTIAQFAERTARQSYLKALAWVVQEGIALSGKPPLPA